MGLSKRGRVRLKNAGTAGMKCISFVFGIATFSDGNVGKKWISDE
jgi:hypothetical protein